MVESLEVGPFPDFILDLCTKGAAVRNTAAEAWGSFVDGVEVVVDGVSSVMDALSDVMSDLGLDEGTGRERTPRGVRRAAEPKSVQINMSMCFRCPFCPQNFRSISKQPKGTIRGGVGGKFEIERDRLIIVFWRARIKRKGYRYISN